MTGALLLTSALMGLAGSVHCAGMCSAACSAAGRACVPKATWRGSVALLGGRLLAYVGAGVLVGVMAESLRWLVDTTVWLKPLWTMAQVALVALGFWLLISGELPATLVQWAERLGRPRQSSGHKVHKVHLPGELKAASIGLLWPLLPCGLLHAALGLAALASTPMEAAQVMGAFALTSSVGLVAGQTLWRWLSATGGSAGAAVFAGRPAIRLAGAGMALVCLWPLLRQVWAPLQAAWCG